MKRAMYSFCEMAAPKIIYEGKMGTKTYIGQFELEPDGFISIDSGETDDQGNKTLTLIPRSRIYTIENIAYEDDRDKPTLTGDHQ